MKKDKIEIQGQAVRVEKREDGEYVCITDIAKTANSNHNDVVRNYFRNGSNMKNGPKLNIKLTYHVRQNQYNFWLKCLLFRGSCKLLQPTLH